LQEIGEIAKRRGIELQEIRVGIRTGDTPAHEKQKMLRVCPHILITTPESMAIMLNSPKFVQKLKDVKWVVVDEVHALADNKRGVHLSLSLERLRHLIGRDFVRVGLSATIHPLDEVAKFLVGYEKGKVRDCYVVDASFIKEKEIKLVSPVRNIIATPGGGLTRAMYKKLTELIKQHRTTLVFTNTRSGTERVVFHLKQTLPKKQIGIEEEEIAAHHGSLSRLVRWDVEERLKRGELRAIISSTSLELGIDIGYIDLVAQLGSPKSVTRCTQRIGRAGHALTAVIKGRILCMDLDDLVECAVMVREVYAHHLDRVQIPEKCLDVLAQHLLGMAITKKWSLDEALEVIRGSYCYRELTKEELANVLNFLSGGYVTLEDYKVYGKCWFDPSDEMFGRRGKYARVIYMLNIGTIPDEVMMRTYTTDGRYIGQLEEEFVERLTKGDRFVLGGRVYEFSSAYGIKVRVKPAFDSKPTVPRWFSEQLPLSFDLALEIGKFREWMFSCLERGVGKKEIVRYLKEVCYADDYSASSIYNYFKVEHDYLKKLGLSEFPSHRNILIEEFIDEWGRKIMVYHTLYGRRVNDAFSRACAYLASKRIRRNVGLAVHDNGFALILPGEYEVEPLSQLNPQNLESVLKEAIARTELLRRRFRHCANRGLMILRNYKGYEIKVSKQQISASTLLKVCEGLEDFPILNETYREILEDTMDVGNAKRVLADLEQGKVRLTKLKVDVPSPFAHGVVLVGMSDVVLMEDRQLVLQRLYNQVLRKLRGR
jgi:ATP-dependent Lhr-like helicase